jgi:hypothetical protein
MFRGDTLLERKPSGYKNVNTSSIKIINENNLKTTQEIKVEQSQNKTYGISEFINQVRNSILSNS